MSAALRLALPSRRATTRLAARLAPLLAPGDLLIASGPLGAGKTFWVRALCRRLGVPGSTRVTSPTFTLVQHYDVTLRDGAAALAHADLYRLGGTEAASDEAADDVRELGLDAARAEGALLVVEWGEPFIRVLGGDALVLGFEPEPRAVSLRATGPRSEQLCAELRAALARAPLDKPRRLLRPS